MASSLVLSVDDILIRLRASFLYEQVEALTPRIRQASLKQTFLPRSTKVSTDFIIRRIRFCFIIFTLCSWVCIYV
jgi:hypothetical protein